jgi:hypothetical protein
MHAVLNVKQATLLSVDKLPPYWCTSMCIKSYERYAGIAAMAADQKLMRAEPVLQASDR